MSGSLQHVDDPIERCHACGKPADGPCLGCPKSFCADCVELEQTPTKTIALCRGCAVEHQHEHRSRWLSLLLWLVGVLAVLALLAFGLPALFGH